MADILGEQPLGLSAYENFVVTERRQEPIDTGSKWGEHQAQRLEAEADETMSQHGPGTYLLFPKGYSDVSRRAVKDHPELIHDTADEMGDLLWYGFDTAAHLNKNVGEITASVLELRADETGAPIATFQELQDAVIAHAPTTLAENPLRAFARAQIELTDALRALHSQSAEPAAAPELSPKLDKALGDYIIAIAYIAKTRLGLNIEDIARYNTYKLRKRKEVGKEIGNLFGEFSEKYLQT